MLDLLISVVEKVAIWGAGAASIGVTYQPRTPECLLGDQK